MLKKILLVTFALPFAIGLQGCTQEEVDTTTIVVGAVVIGAAVAGAIQDSGSDRRPEERRPEGRGPVREPQRPAPECRGPSCRRMDAKMDLNLSAPAASIEARAVAKKYELSLIGAQKIVDVFVGAKSGQVDNFRSLGLSTLDLLSISAGRMPSEDGLQMIARELSSSVKATQSLMVDVTKAIEFKLEQDAMNRASVGN